MKQLRVALPIVFLLSLSFNVFASHPRSGFFLPDSLETMTLTYRMIRGLIVLPVTINDSINVNLVLDTGCRNVVLFGKRFTSLFDISSSRPVEFSGLGSGKPVVGALSLGNKVSIEHVLGEQIPVVVVRSGNVFGNYNKIDGVIGYDIFFRFEIELNSTKRTITFRPAQRATAPAGFTTVPLKIVDARPILESSIYMHKRAPHKVELMIDTGSSLGLLLKTTNIGAFSEMDEEKVLGMGFNGPLSGYKTKSRKIQVAGLEIEDVQTGIVSSDWHNNASIGMNVLKDYIVILNYCKQYACFKRADA